MRGWAEGSTRHPGASRVSVEADRTGRGLLRPCGPVGEMQDGAPSVRAIAAGMEKSRSLSRLGSQRRGLFGGVGE